MKFLNFFLLIWVIFPLLGSDPDSEYGSGSTDLIEFGFHTDPNLQHWLYSKEQNYFLKNNCNFVKPVFLNHKSDGRITLLLVFFTVSPSAKFFCRSIGLLKVRPRSGKITVQYLWNKTFISHLTCILALESYCSTHLLGILRQCKGSAD